MLGVCRPLVVALQAQSAGNLRAKIGMAKGAKLKAKRAPDRAIDPSTIVQERPGPKAKHRKPKRKRDVHVTAAGMLIMDQRAKKVIRDVRNEVNSEAQFTEEVKSDLIDLIARGHTLTEACAALNVSYRLVTSLRRSSVPFAQALALAREDGAEGRVHDADKALRKAMRSKSHVEVTAAANFAHHARWVASKLNVNNFGDRTAVDANVAVTDERRNTLRDQILESAAATVQTGDSQRAER